MFHGAPGMALLKASDFSARPRKVWMRKVFFFLICFSTINLESQPEVESFKMDVYRKVTRIVIKTCFFSGIGINFNETNPRKNRKACQMSLPARPHIVLEFCEFCIISASWMRSAWRFPKANQIFISFMSWRWSPLRRSQTMLFDTIFLAAPT